MKWNRKLYFWTSIKFQNLGANVHGREPVSSWKIVGGTYHGIRNTSENRISSDPVNVLTKVEIWDTLVLSYTQSEVLHSLKSGRFFRTTLFETLNMLT